MLAGNKDACGLSNRVPIESIEQLEFFVKEREARTGKPGALFVGNMSDSVVSFHILSRGHGFEVVPASGRAGFFVPADFVDHTIGHLIGAGRFFGYLN